MLFCLFYNEKTPIKWSFFIENFFIENYLRFIKKYICVLLCIIILPQYFIFIYKQFVISSNFFKVVFDGFYKLNFATNKSHSFYLCLESLLSIIRVIESNRTI